MTSKTPITKTNTVNLWAGLPIATLMGADADTTAKAVQDFLRGPHTWHADGVERRLDVATVVTASQPVGAMFDYLLTDKGEMTPDKKLIYKREIGILGIGMNTVDLLVVAGGAPVERFTLGANAGVRRLLELTNSDGLYSLAERDDQLRAGTLDLSTAQPVWAREVLGLIEQTWETKFKRFGAIVVVGGGSLLMLGAIALAAWWSLPSLLFITPAAVVFLAGIAFVQRTYGPRSWELGEQSAELTPLNADSALNRHENKKSGTHSAS